MSYYKKTQTNEIAPQSILIFVALVLSAMMLRGCYLTPPIGIANPTQWVR